MFPTVARLTYEDSRGENATPGASRTPARLQPSAEPNVLAQALQIHNRNVPNYPNGLTTIPISPSLEHLFP